MSGPPDRAAATIRCGDWASLRDAAAAVRTTVFIVEQRIPPELEWDDEDPVSVHCVAFVDGEPAATGRLLPDGRIGRMAVLAARRAQGLGGAILERLVAVAAGRGHARVRLSAQCHAEGFYRRHGFEPDGAVFDEAGIPHLPMLRALRQAEGPGDPEGGDPAGGDPEGGGSSG